MTRSKESSRNASPITLDLVQKELSSLAEQIEDAKTKVNKLTGARDESYRRLKQDFRVSTLQEATKKLESMETELLSIEKRIISGFNELKKNYSW